MTDYENCAGAGPEALLRFTSAQLRLFQLTNRYEILKEATAKQILRESSGGSALKTIIFEYFLDLGCRPFEWAKTGKVVLKSPYAYKKDRRTTSDVKANWKA